MSMPAGAWDGGVGYPESRLPELNAAVGRGLDCIARASGTARALVDAGVRVLLPKELPNAGQATPSASWRAAIGLVAIGNPLRAEWSPQRMADALVHEAIHQLLYKVELRQPFFVDLGTASRLEVVSPWSGSTLKLTQFAHACLVWAGLWHLWRRWEGKEPAVEQLRRRAAGGFAGGTPLSLLTVEARRALDRRALDALEMVCESVAQRD